MVWVQKSFWAAPAVGILPPTNYPPALASVLSAHVNQSLMWTGDVSPPEGPSQVRTKPKLTSRPKASWPDPRLHFWPCPWSSNSEAQAPIVPRAAPAPSLRTWSPFCPELHCQVSKPTWLLWSKPTPLERVFVNCFLASILLHPITNSPGLPHDRAPSITLLPILLLSVSPYQKVSSYSTNFSAEPRTWEVLSDSSLDNG